MTACLGLGESGRTGSFALSERDANYITAFSFDALQATGTINGQSIVVRVPYNTDVTDLVPTITVADGATVTPESGVGQDFSSPVIYTAKAEDGTSKVYTVTVTGATYSLRDVGPASGLIFYAKSSYSNGWKYLEAAPNDQASEKPWFTSYWYAGVTSGDVGAGQTNTSIIVASPTAAGSAAKSCSDLVLNGYGDWFLPSRDELSNMYTELQLHGVGNFTAPSLWYWSSSEYNQMFAWELYFGLNGGGGANRGSKDIVSSVRCARAF